jgi:hypothetical protein
MRLIQAVVGRPASMQSLRRRSADRWAGVAVARTVGAPYFGSLKAAQHQAGSGGPVETEGFRLGARPSDNDHD